MTESIEKSAGMTPELDVDLQDTDGGASQVNGPQTPGEAYVYRAPDSHANSLRRFKKSVERAITRATGELQAYSEALGTLVHDRHIKSIEDSEAEQPRDTNVGPPAALAEAPAQNRAGSSNESASNALLRLVKQSKSRRKSQAVNIESDEVSQLIEETILKAAPSPALPVGQPETVPTGREGTDKVAQFQAPHLIEEQLAPQAEGSNLGVQTHEDLQSGSQRPPTQPLSPGGEMQPVEGSMSGFHNLMARADRAVKRTTGEVHVYVDAVSKLVQTRAHPQRCPDEPHVADTAAAAPQLQESGLHGFVGRAIRRTTGEMAALRSQLSQLVDEARVKENAKSQERIQSLQTTERLPLPTPERLETNKFASLCPSVWQDLSGGDQYRHCNQCGLFVYDFKGKSLPEVEKIVFQREGLTNPTFYRRADGRFLLRDCPVGLARRQKRMIAAATVVLVVGTLVVAGLLMPKPPPQPAQVSPEVQVPASASKRRQPEKAAGLESQQQTPGGPGGSSTTGPGTTAPENQAGPGGSSTTGPGTANPENQAHFALPQPNQNVEPAPVLHRRQGLPPGEQAGKGF